MIAVAGLAELAGAVGIAVVIITWLVVVEPVEVAGVAVSVTLIVCVRSCVFVRVVVADWTSAAKLQHAMILWSNM